MSLGAATRIVSRGSLALLAGTAASLSIGEYVGSDSKAVRSFRFWKGMVPIYTHYKLVEHRLKDETDPEKISAAYKPLNQRYSPRVEKLALELKGFYYKLAQVLSTRDDFLPDEYLTWTKQLQDKSPAVLPSSDIEKVVEKDLGKPISEIFQEWDPKPIGAASVGQVHHAVLADDNKTDVAVKVQYPGIERKFRNDIETVELFCKYLMPQNVSFFREIKKQYATEFDMRGEADNLREVHNNLHLAGWNSVVAIPYPVYSSKQVLVMTYLPGKKLVDGIREYFESIAERMGVTLEEFEAEQKQKIERDAEEGRDSRVDIKAAAAWSKRVEWLLRLRNVMLNPFVYILNMTVRPLVSKTPWAYFDSTTGPGSGVLNLGQVMDTLIRVHGHEIFADGAFNGDPHPGNVLLMPDGRLGLIDYGQVKRMTVSDRIMYAKLIIALSRDDRDEVVRIAREESGFSTKFSNNDVTFRSMAFFHCRDTEDVLGGLNVSEFMEWMEKEDPVQNINDEFVMVGRVSLLLRGLANAFGIKVRISDYWCVEADKFLKSQGIDY